MTHWVGIDVAKTAHKYRILDDAGRFSGKALSVTNTREGCSAFVERLRSLGGDVRIGIEATGPYWLALYDLLTTAGFSVTVFNPLQIKAFRETGLRKTKCDSKDAYWIAEFLRVGHGRPQFVADPPIETLKELSRYRVSLMEEACNHKRRILGTLSRVFPEYEELFSDVFLASSRALLETATTPEQILALDTDKLAELLRKASRGRFGQDKALEVRNAAQNTIGVSWLADAAKIEILSMLEIIKLLELQISKIEAELARLMSTIPQQITTVSGVGPILGAAIIGETGDIHRFPTGKSFVAYAGLDPSVHQSGGFTAAETHMSKRGSPHLRRALWLVAVNAYRFDPTIQAYYNTKIAQGKNHNAVIGAIARKMAGRIYAVWKSNQPYNTVGPTQEAGPLANQ